MTLSLFSLINVSALGYQGSANIGFTFEPTLSISISSDLVVPNLTPGTVADSNSINVSVATNTAYGYSINASVGNSSTYNNRNLNPVNSDSSNDDNTVSSFTSLDYGSTILDKSNFNDNTWGYSYSLNNGTTWQPYSGLPLHSDINNSAVLFGTYGAANSKTIDFKIAARASNAQSSGEYTNVINFYAVSNPEPPTLYDTVKYMTKGTLAENNVNLSDTITQANSGVYTYDPAVYGVASDASNDYDIYFYRGILDTDEGLGTYGSDGLADAWPNYVKLGNNTCWRIVRTTGSGGVKMIYNGLYGATTAGSCANAQNNAAIGSSPFNNATYTVNGKTYYGLQYQNIQAVGYTYSNKVEPGTTEPTTLSDLFGASGNDTTTNTNDSIIKQFIEDWYAANMNSYTSRIETSAGYCNNRAISVSYNNIGQILPEDTRILPYGTSNMPVLYFYSYVSSRSQSQNSTFDCYRGNVDIYSATTSNGGNGQLLYPTALLTGDESIFSGAGGRGDSTSNKNSFLWSGQTFWFLSPITRYADGGAGNLSLEGGTTNAPYTGYYYVSTYYGVRPVISLMHHIQVTGGIGTATSPWTIE